MKMGIAMSVCAIAALMNVTQHKFLYTFFVGSGQVTLCDFVL